MASNTSSSDSQIVNLDSLNLKQKAKEFKATQKDIKSKELPIKLAAIEKCQDRRYISEGSCFSPLILSVIPKKKNLEYAKISYDKICSLIDTPNSTESPTVETSPVLAALNVYYKDFNNLDFIKVISDAIIFKEEIKKQKKPKKKKDQTVVEELPPIIMNPDYKSIRISALKSLYKIMLNLYNASETEFASIKTAVATIENIHLNLFTVLSDIEIDLEKNPRETITSECSLQVAIYALMTLVFVLRNNNEAITAFVSKSSKSINAENEVEPPIEVDPSIPPPKTILAIVQNLSTINCLSHYCLQILQIISKENKEGLELLSIQENKEHLLLLLDMSKHVLEYSASPIIQPEYMVFKGVEELECHRYLKTVGNLQHPWFFVTGEGEKRPDGIEPVESLAPVAAKGGKDDKKKKDDKAAVPTEPVDPLVSLDRIKIDHKRSCACSIRIICMVLTKITNLQKDLISEDVVRVVSTRISSLLTNKSLWEVVRDPHSFPLDEPISDVMEEISILSGSMGLVNFNMRKIIVENGVLTSSLALLQQSQTVVSGISLEVATPPPDKAAKGGKGAPAVVTPVDPPVIDLNEQQVLQLTNLRRICERTILILIANSEKIVEENVVVVIPFEKNRWNNGQKYVTAKDILNLSGSDVYTNKVVDMIAVKNDEDLSNRSCRILSAIIVGLENPLEYIIENSLESSLVEKISKVINERGVSIIDDFHVETKPLEPPSLESVEQKEESRETIETVNGDDGTLTIVGKEEPGKQTIVDLLIPKKTESLYYMSLILETLLMSSTVENINIFGTTDRVKTIVSLLKCLGPCCNSVKSSDKDDPKDPNVVIEFQTVLYDPRVYSWRPVKEENISDVIYIRPILIDVLSLVTLADSKFRTYEGELPAEVLKPLPVSKSVCEEASLTVCKYASDVLFSVLSNQSKLAICCDNVVAVPVSDGYKLPVSVLHAALRLVKAISSCGPVGLAASLEAIAENGFSNLTNKPDQGERFDSRNIYSMKLLDSFIQSISVQEESVPSEWKRPLFFDEIYSSNDYLTTQNEITKASSLWPFIVISMSLIPLISDPTNSKESSFLALEAIKSLVQFIHQNDHSQPVLADILATTFISLGGGVALTGIIGRFGNVENGNKEYIRTFISYLLQRGKCRKDFWMKWAEDNKEVVVLDPKTGKPIPKKEDKKAAPAKENKKDPKAVQVVPIVPEILWNLESTEAIPDPNHGPNDFLWINIMNIKCDDLYEKCSSASLLTSAIQGCESNIAIELIDLGVDVNQIDGACLSAIMYSLCLGNVEVTKHLISHNADVNALDSERNPVVKYALLSVSIDDINTFLPGFMAPTYNQSEAIKVFGTPSVLDIFLNSNVDINVCDPNGYNPLLISLGLGCMTVVIGGYSLDILSASYNNVLYDINLIHSVVNTLLDVNCWINFCSVDGVIPMHIAAARGDLELINSLALRESIINAVDSRGLTPLHYLSIATPNDCITVFDALMELAVNRPLDRMAFDDYRTGQSEEYKNGIEVDRFINKSFTSTLFPESIGKLRLLYGDLLHTVSDGGMNLLQLCLCGNSLFKDHPLFGPLLFGDKDMRMTFSLHFYNCVKPIDNGLQLISNIDVEGLSVLHAASLLFQGVTEKRELTEREKRSKRVKTYPSKEINLVEIILACPTIDVNGICYRNMEGVIGLSSWNAMHAAIHNDNPDMINYLIDNGFDIFNGPKYLSFLIQSKNNHSIETIKLLIEKLSENPNYKTHLNEIESEDIRRPLLMAVRNNKIDIIKILVTNPKVDLNIIDESTNTTAFHEACLTGSLDLIQSFRTATDRIDLLATGKKNNCIIDIIESNNTELLLELISMRRNDVIETLLSENNNESSYLIKLEEENIKLAKILGYNLPSDNNNNNNDDNNELVYSEEEKEGLEGIVSINEVQNSLENMKLKEYSEIPISDDFSPSDEAKGEMEQLKLNNNNNNNDNNNEPILSVEECNLKFKSSNNILKIIIDLVNSTGIIMESHHAHKIFFDGNLIIDNTN